MVSDFNFQYEELLAYIGMNIAMGILRLPSIADYWTTEVLSTPSVMPRDRFYAITRHFHLVDSTKQAKKKEIGYDPLFKVRPVIDQISDCCKKYYQPGQELSIDEMMIGTRCRISFLQYMPKNPQSSV